MTDERKRSSTYPLSLPSAMRTADFFAERSARADIEAARRILRRDGGQPPEPEDRLDAEDAEETEE